MPTLVPFGNIGPPPASNTTEPDKKSDAGVNLLPTF